jgi:hypothetical protein
VEKEDVWSMLGISKQESARNKGTKETTNNKQNYIARKIELHPPTLAVAYRVELCLGRRTASNCSIMQAEAFNHEKLQKGPGLNTTTKLPESQDRPDNISQSSWNRAFRPPNIGESWEDPTALSA